MDDALASLVAALGSDVVMTDNDRMAAHVVDWTGRWTGHTPAIVSPRSLDDVVATIMWCRRNRMAVVPQGGNTGMVGGSVPLAGETVMSLTRLTSIHVNGDSGTLVAGAGATLAEVQRAAADAGWTYGVDLGARDSATIGGTVATNAGGLQVLRHGDTRRQLLGVEAVTGTGAVVGDLRGLTKDNTGYHLPSLLCGSEGTLAVITRVCVRLVPQVAETAVAILGFATEAEAIAAVRRVRLGVPDLQALELFFADGMELVCSTFEMSPPLREAVAAYLLVEVGGPAGAAARLATDLGRIDVDLANAAVGTDASQRTRLWRYREAHTEAINLVGVPHKLDVTIPLGAMGAFVHDVRALVYGRYPGARVWLFGHAGDGNLHVNVTGVDTTDTGLDASVLDLVATMGGSISAEHGIGRAKTPHLHLNRTPADLDLARRIKAAFDPDGILNPGVLFPSDSRG